MSRSQICAREVARKTPPSRLTKMSRRRFNAGLTADCVTLSSCADLKTRSVRGSASMRSRVARFEVAQHE
jgi:hypothetical protein